MCGVLHPFDSLIQFHHHWPFNLACLPVGTYLVGGSVRDVLLGRHAEHLDLDFVLPTGAIDVASQIARQYNAGFVLLDEERQIARVVFPTATADFAQQVGPTLDTDLQRRDFTINAIAYNPHSQELYDPVGGHADLRDRKVQMVSHHNLQEDPLRLLRAYRQAAQLNFSLATDTQVSLRQLAPLLKHVAAERVQAELRYLLCTTHSIPWVTVAWQDQILNTWLAHTDASHIAHYTAIHTALQMLDASFPGFSKTLQMRVHDSTFAPKRSASDDRAIEYHGDRNLLIVAKLTSLVARDPALAEQELNRLKFSRAEIRSVGVVLRSLLLLPSGSDALTLRQQYLLFQAVGPIFPAFAIVALGCGVPKHQIIPLVERFLSPYDPVAHPHTLVTGKDLMQALHLKAGPLIGQLLSAIQYAQAEGNVTSREQALDFSEQWLVHHPTDGYGDAHMDNLPKPTIVSEMGQLPANQG
jgi:tRNA nucleotidyltransferase (CCA-adding enzyme)